MTVQATQPITAEQLFAMGDIGRCELVRGEIIKMAPAGAEHGDVAGELLYLIKSHVKQHNLGKVYAAETGFTLARNPDTTRAPDVAFVKRERVPIKPRRSFFEGAPDLAVEVVSPSDTKARVTSKVDEWLDAGTVSVWVVDPINRCIEVYRHGTAVIRYRDGDELVEEPTLPGFALHVTGLFNAV